MARLEFIQQLFSFLFDCFRLWSAWSHFPQFEEVDPVDELSYFGNRNVTESAASQVSGARKFFVAPVNA
ncbi:hypothetical protein EVA_15161 [gut metagenome]|uniref:Uncharacterized protein n=1 Tax=gut metagenome TaxID=749906 RepID=J9G4I6_9ZZZZ